MGGQAHALRRWLSDIYIGEDTAWEFYAKAFGINSRMISDYRDQRVR